MEKYTNPWLHLKFQYGNAKGKAFTEEEDRFIVCMTHQLGYGRWEELKYEVRRSWNFRFDWFNKSRTPKELDTPSYRFVRAGDGYEAHRRARKRSRPPHLARDTHIV